MEFINWKNTFDGRQLKDKNSLTLSEMNEFVYNRTYYSYFVYSDDKVYMSMNPHVISPISTGLNVSELEK
jgi:hypothetical protein